MADPKEEAERQARLAYKAERAHVRRSHELIRSLWLPVLAVFVVGSMALAGLPEKAWTFVLIVFGFWMLMRWFWTLGR